MKKTIFMLVIIVLTSSIFAETIILNDGRNFEGKIVGKKDGFIYLQKNEKIFRFFQNNIETIENDSEQPIMTIFMRKKDFMKINPNELNITEIALQKNYIINHKKITKKSTKYDFYIKYDLKMLPVTIISGFLTFRSIQALSYYQNEIDNTKKTLDSEYITDDEKSVYKETLEEIKKMKNNEIMNAIAFGSSTVLSLAISFKKVEIKANPTSVNVSYRF